MKIPFSWLKDHVDVGAMSPESVADKLTIAGLEVVLIEKISGDSIFDIEVTPNRPDCLSVIGIAREAAAALKKSLKFPDIKPPKAKLKDKPSIEIKDKELCPRYTGRIIQGVKVGPSPDWLAGRIGLMDLRPVNNVVDITNYCLFALGQPTHAFDRDKLKGGITVRRARKGEEIVTIDEKKRILDADMLVIADEEKPVALAGVMGSKDTEVTEKTTGILFESAYFNPVSIRRTSRRLGLISESSYRFERSVDKGAVVSASDMACGLITKLCGGSAGPLADAGSKDAKSVKISLNPAKIKSVLGLSISTPAIKKILMSLQLEVKGPAKKKLTVHVPSFRQDLKNEVDLIEEVVRVYGYDKLPSTMPTPVGHPTRIERSRRLCDIARESLASLGGCEIITYSLISKDDLKFVECPGGRDLVTLKNPLSIEQEVMRPTLIPGCLRAVSWNLNKGTKKMKIFEIGKVYLRSSKGFSEEDSLSIAFAGDTAQGWHDREEPLLFDLKGMLESLFEKLGVMDKIKFRSDGLPPVFTAAGGAMEIEGETIGFLGKVKKKTLGNFDIKADAAMATLSLEKLFSYVRPEKRYRPMPKFPSAKRDLSVMVAKNVSHQTIVSIIKETGGSLVASVELFDQYLGAQIPKGFKGLAYSIEFRANDRTLTDEEVSGLHGKITESLTRQLDAKIR